MENANQLAETGAGLLAALRDRQAAGIVVERVADIMLAWQPNLHFNFAEYCDLAIQARAELDNKSKVSLRCPDDRLGGRTHASPLCS